MKRAAAEMTGWFPPEVKPVHEGWYERLDELDGEIWRSWWNGEFFSHRYDGLDVRSIRRTPWRGLASNPKKRGRE